MTTTWLAFGLLGGLGLLHSVLGQKEIISPLVADRRWEIALPRRGVDRLLTFAWHLTTVAWFGLAAVVVGASPAVAVSGVCLTSALIIFIALRGHLAWPLFLVAGLSALHSGGLLPAGVFVMGACAGSLAALAVAVLHAYWAVGGAGGKELAIPTDRAGEPLFSPGSAVTWMVVGALMSYVGLVLWPLLGTRPKWALWVVGVATLVLTLRAIGDGRYIGFSKSWRGSQFARLDDLYYTPLVVLLALGGVGSLTL